MMLMIVVSRHTQKVPLGICEVCRLLPFTNGKKNGII